ncbi:MAG: hypothetical protein IPL01_08730 [Acidobacteria bacterium]|nr:hypothetical protein [Acidobacteriota bacterium]
MLIALESYDRRVEFKQFRESFWLPARNIRQALSRASCGLARATLLFMATNNATIVLSVVVLPVLRSAREDHYPFNRSFKIAARCSSESSIPIFAVKRSSHFMTR